MKQFKAFEAPHHYDFVDPDTARKFQASSKIELISQIEAYRGQNNLPKIEGIDIVLENYWCGQVENAGKCKECPPEFTRGFTEYINGGLIMLKSMLMKNFAPQEVAEERSKQCEICEFNVFIDRGPFVTGVDDIAVQCVGTRRVSNKEKLGQCACCLCPLRSKVFINEPLPKFTPKQVQRMKSVSCWQLALSGQDKE